MKALAIMPLAGCIFAHSHTTSTDELVTDITEHGSRLWVSTCKIDFTVTHWSVVGPTPAGLGSTDGTGIGLSTSDCEGHDVRMPVGIRPAVAPPLPEWCRTSVLAWEGTVQRDRATVRARLRDGCAVRRHDLAAVAQATTNLRERGRLLAALPDCNAIAEPTDVPVSERQVAAWNSVSAGCRQSILEMQPGAAYDLPPISRSQIDTPPDDSDDPPIRRAP